jgi:hypothetical protein
MKTDLFILDLLKYPSAWKGHGYYAIKLCKTLKPKVVVDLGVDYGFSTFCFAYGSESGEVYGVDSFEGDGQAGVRDTLAEVEQFSKILHQKYKMKKPNFIKGYFSEVAATWDKGQIDLLHIDGLHTTEAVTEDYQNWSRYLSPDGVILFHDIISYPDILSFFEGIEGGYKFKFDHSNGLGVYAKSELAYNLAKAANGNQIPV